MRYVVLALFFTSHVAISQQLSINSGNLRAPNPFSLAINFNNQSDKVIDDQDRWLPKEVLDNSKSYVSSMRVLTPNDFYFNTPPLTSGPVNPVMFGQTMTQSVNFLGIKSSVRYVFDHNNNLIDHEWSFSLKRKKKKNSKSITPSWRLNR